MKKNICIVTGSRAEFGLLFPIIDKINNSKLLSLSLVVTGSHLDKFFGNTLNEITDKNIKIKSKISLPLDFDNSEGMSKCISVAITKFSSYLKENRTDLLIVLGDRYEIFGVCIAAAMMKIPIAHIAGGETTQGAIDEFIRHSITKMAYFHFVTCEEYRKRVIQLGEDPKRVFNVGSLSADNVKSINIKNCDLVLNSLSMCNYDKYCLVTFHPETLNQENVEKQMNELITALDNNKNLYYIVTKANADAGGLCINRIWDREIKNHSNWRLVTSLGFEKYLSLMKKCQMVIGNSSSGVIEAPILKVPTVNIGDRQKGRYMCKSIVNCECNSKDIIKAVNKAQSIEFKNSIQNMENPFGNGKTSNKIIKILEKEMYKNINLKKEFYDIKYKL